MIIRIVYFFVANIVLFLIYEKTGIVLLQLNGPGAVYAAAGLFSSAGTLVLFLLASVFYSANRRRWRRFAADLVLTLIASIVPLIVLLLASLIFGVRFSIGGPFISKLLSAWSYSLPVVWIGWSALNLLLFKWLDPPDGSHLREAESGDVEFLESAVKEIDLSPTLYRDSQVNTGTLTGTGIGTTSGVPRWMRLYDFACFQLDEGNYEEARPKLSEVVTILMQESTVDPVVLLKVSTQLGDCLIELGDYGAATEHYERALILLRRPPGGDDLLFVKLMTQLKMCYQKSMLPPE